MPSPETITYSALQALWRCPESYRLAYRLGLRPIGYSGALAIGTAYHAAQDPAVGHELAMDGLAQEQAEAGEAGEKAEADRALASVLAGARRKFGVVLPDGDHEVPWQRTIPGRRGFRAAGVVDCWDAGGPIGVVELKTCSSLLDAAIEHQHSLQVPLYQWGMGDDRPALLDLARKPRLRRRKDESAAELAHRLWTAIETDPSAYFETIELPHDTAAERWTIGALQAAVDLIRHCDKRGWPRRHGAGCRTPYGWCRYRDLCWHGNADKYEIKQTDPGLAPKEQNQ